MKLRLFVNPAVKSKPIATLVSFNFACHKSDDSEISVDSTIKDPVLKLLDSTIIGNTNVANKLCELANLSFFPDSDLNSKNNELIKIATEKIPDGRTLPQNCDLLVRLMDSKYQFFVHNEISSADIFLWEALLLNSRWNLLKKDKKYQNISDWFSLLQSREEFNKNFEILEKPKSTKVNKNYNSLDIGIDSSMKGKVVTRFPPEPSGFLHIGHVKAAMLNSTIAKIWDGKMIVRFDDTNPSKEKGEYVENILSDLKTLKIDYWKVTHTSDYFPLLFNLCEQLIRTRKAYVEDTPVEIMRKERMELTESKNRENSVEKNLSMWQEMVQGSAKYIVRIKIDMKSPNGSLRDPTIYRCNTEIPHLKTGERYKVYPTYDFAVPVVDTVEGVTNCFRSSEYNDRGEQYKRIWNLLFKKSKNEENSVFQIVVAALKEEEKPPNFSEDFAAIAQSPKMPKVKTFSRANFVGTVLSKRKLEWFVTSGKVFGWDDPRFPTVQGILRRGLTVEGLREFTLQQGFSLHGNLMEWDKLWSINKKILDPIAPRYTAVDKDCVRVHLMDGPEEVEGRTVSLHPKNKELGVKVIRIVREILIERIDAENLSEGEEVTLIEWGNIVIDRIDLGQRKIIAHLNLDGDVKKTQKLTWLADSGADLVNCILVHIAPLITVDKLEGDMELETVYNTESWVEKTAYGDPNLRNLKKGEIVQLQRKSFAIVDKQIVDEKIDSLVLVVIPDSKSKPMVSKLK